ncbi:MAG: hypothetical protein KAI66_04070, partial [Lentisphaeria bacterium]|nr:hypothetical protein [Lentisphaeria bacterium]
LAFTDEPAVTSVRPPDWITWTPGMERLYAEQFGHDIHEDLPLLFAPPHADMPPCGAQTRIDFFDLWTTRFAEAYFMPLRQWCRENGLASAGHLGGEDETLGAIRHGFGHAMRQLRALDLPGVDVIWRQLVPGRPNQHHFPKFASSSAHQNGTRHTFTESFAVYGNGLTPAQMKWLVDYQFVRGIDLLVGACYPFGTREHHMTGERPHFGRCNPLWDHMNGFHAYAARLGYCLSVGTPDISVALYYPVRDLWAWGEEAEDAVASHDGLAAELFAHQCDFDLVDDDALVSASIEDGRLAVGPMRYATIVCGETCWMQAEARSRLQSFADAGGVVLCLRHAPGIAGESDADANSFQVSRTIPELVGQIEPTVFLTPPACDVRVSARRVADGRMLMLFNEGNAAYAGRIRVGSLHVYRLHPSTGGIEKVPDTTQDLPVELGAWESALFLLSDAPLEAASPCPMTEDTLELDATMLAVPHRRFIAGEHDFEILDLAEPATSFDRGAIWCDWLGEDFSGEVEYKVDFDVPDAWAESPLQLETGEIEHAATVFLDGASIGQMAWAPWRLLLPPCSAGHHELVIRVANTLANELTSDRVVKEWATKSGPGWPGVYHKRALEQEEETKGGGLRGPILLRRMRKAGCCGVLHAYP